MKPKFMYTKKSSRPHIVIISLISTITFLTSTAIPAQAVETSPEGNVEPRISQEYAKTIKNSQELSVSQNVEATKIASDTYTVVTKEEIDAAQAAVVAAELAAIEATRIEEENRNNNSFQRQYDGPVPGQVIPADSVIAAAQQWVGVVPYGSGNHPSDSFSCDGYTQYVFSQVGIHLPRTVSAQYAMGTEIPKSEALAGDLIIWVGQHVAIYDGNGGMYDSPYEGKYVQHRGDIWGNPVFIRL